MPEVTTSEETTQTAEPAKPEATEKPATEPTAAPRPRLPRAGCVC